jgi:hypothetical protein
MDPSPLLASTTTSSLSRELKKRINKIHLSRTPEDVCSLLRRTFVTVAVRGRKLQRSDRCNICAGEVGMGSSHSGTPASSLQGMETLLLNGVQRAITLSMSLSRRPMAAKALNVSNITIIQALQSHVSLYCWHGPRRGTINMATLLEEIPNPPPQHLTVHQRN